MAAVEALSVDEKGTVLGLARGGQDALVATRIAGQAGARCRVALAALATCPEAERAATLAAVAIELGRAVPDGLERVHPGWLRRALDGERSEIVTAVAVGLPEAVGRVVDEIVRAREEAPRPAWRRAAGPALDDLRRALFAEIVPMPIGPGAAARMPRAYGLCALSAAALADEIDRRGAETIGHALAGAPAEALARAAAGAGAALAPALFAAARSGPAGPTRDAARALVAAVPPEEAARGAVRAVGLRAVARELGAEGPAALAAVAQALPPALGDALVAGAR